MTDKTREAIRKPASRETRLTRNPTACNANYDLLKT